MFQSCRKSKIRGLTSHPTINNFLLVAIEADRLQTKIANSERSTHSPFLNRQSIRVSLITAARDALGNTWSLGCSLGSGNKFLRKCEIVHDFRFDGL